MDSKDRLRKIAIWADDFLNARKGRIASQTIFRGLSDYEMWFLNQDTKVK